MRIKRHFAASNIEGQDDPLTPLSQQNAIYQKFKLPSHWSPAPGQDESLETFINLVRKEIIECQISQPLRHNLNVAERQVLETLKNDPNIVIKKADKGSAVVVMNLEDYVHEADRQLSDPETYRVIGQDPTADLNIKVKRLLREMTDQEHLTEDNYDYLYNEDATLGKFYLLPKIHKKGVPGRPICNTIGHPTARISELVDVLLQPHVPSIKSYIKDTTDFLAKIREVPALQEGGLIATLDVTALYTNIPNQQGIVACHRKLEEAASTAIPPQYVSRMLDLVLKNNTFVFNDKMYKQLGGTAMGTKLAPAYANIFMGNLEEKLLAGYPLKPDLWLRFIDDIFLIWNHGEQNLIEFVEYLNSAHRSIKFTSEYSHTSVNFLDTKVCIDPSTKLLYTDLYTKPTDTHDYLHYSSSHPKSCKDSGPYSQLLRVKRICSKNEDCERHQENILGHYRRRGYPPQVLANNREKAKNNQPPRTQSGRMPLVLTYNPCNPNIIGIFKKHWDVLSVSPMCSEIFQELPMLAHKRTANLKDLLVRSKISTGNTPVRPPTQRANPRGPIQPCTYRKCKACPLLVPGPIVSSKTGVSYPINRGIHCTTRNVVYLITCQKCKKQYVGESKRVVGTRLKEHLGTIKKQNNWRISPGILQVAA